jgi:hypothetical protein
MLAPPVRAAAACRVASARFFAASISFFCMTFAPAPPSSAIAPIGRCRRGNRRWEPAFGGDPSPADANVRSRGPRFSDHGCEVSQQLDDFRGRRELIGGRKLLVRDPTNSSSRACISPIASFRLVARCTHRFAPCGSGSSVGNLALDAAASLASTRTMISARMVRRLRSLSRCIPSRSSESILIVRGTRIFGRMARIALASVS